MRTTLTIDDDVAAMLDQVTKLREASFKDLVNEALRRGLRDMTTRPKPRKPFRTRSVDLGRVAIASIDNVADALAIAEGESFG
jgi:hypothetical protein